MALSPDKIREIYAKRRTKGVYDDLLIRFLGMEVEGVSVKEEWQQFADKKATTLKQGFENAKDRKEAPEGSENVDVIVDGEDVFLVNTTLYAPEGSDGTEGDPTEAALAGSAVE